jgi:hypothetical protein
MAASQPILLRAPGQMPELGIGHPVPLLPNVTHYTKPAKIWAPLHLRASIALVKVRAEDWERETG